MTQQLSIKDTRNNLAEIIDQVSVGGDTFVITKFGKPKAMITPITDKTALMKSDLEESFGMWKKRKDIKDSATWVADLRAKMSVRNE